MDGIVWHLVVICFMIFVLPHLVFKTLSAIKYASKYKPYTWKGWWKRFKLHWKKG